MLGRRHRLLKLTKVRVKFDPALNVANGFRWELTLHDGVINIHDQRTAVRVRVDAQHPVIQVDAVGRDGKELAAVVLTLEPWRNTPVTSYPDVVLPAQLTQVGWYTAIWHRRGW